jgi:hypothetical protein
MIKPVLIAAICLLILPACTAAPPVMLHYENFECRSMPYTLAIAPVDVELAAEPLPKDAFGRPAVTFDAEKLRAGLAAGAVHSRLFKEVYTDISMNGHNPDLLLKLTINKAQLVFERFDNWDLTFYLWILAWVPNWYQADEIYIMSISGEMAIMNGKTGRLIYKKKIKLDYSQNLDDFQRGWQMYGLFRVPESLTGENWDQIERTILPYAQNRLIYKVMETLGTRFYKGTSRKNFKKLLGQ